MSSTIGSEIDITNSVIEQAKSDAELLENPNVDEENIDPAREDADQLVDLPQVESATVETNHHGVYIEVVPTDTIAGRSLQEELHRNNFDQYDSFIDIQGV